DSARSFNQDISNWNVSSVRSFNNTFSGAISFDQDLGDWDVQSATGMGRMFNRVKLAKSNYDSLLNSWSSLPNLKNNVQFDAGISQYCAGESSRQDLINNLGWQISDGGRNCASGLLIERVVLIDALNDKPIYTLRDDMQINAASLPSNLLNFEVIASESVESIKMELSDQQEVIASENFAPYSLFGKNGSDYLGNTLEKGTYTLTITPYSEDDLLGTVGTPLVLNFKILDGVPRAFILTFKTDNPGSSDDRTISFRTTPYKSAYYDVKRKGSISGGISAGYRSFTFQQPGTYTIEITGDFPGIYFENNGDAEKLISIDQWGDVDWESGKGAFSGCSNMEILATDVPDLSNATDASGMFAYCTSLSGSVSLAEWETKTLNNISNMFLGAESFNQDVSQWNVSDVINMAGTFNQASSFNQNLGIWNISKTRNMSGMFTGSGLSNENYDSLLLGWSEFEQVQSTVLLDAPQNQYCLGAEARQKLIDDFGWTITDAGKSADCIESQRPFITTWKTDNPGTSADNQITIPTFPGGTYNYSVDWGDGSSDSGVADDITHSYATPGTYTVEITGEFPRIYFNFSGDINKILLINQWGDIVWQSMVNAFSQCNSLDVTALDIPNFSETTDLSRMFFGCSSLIGVPSFNNWDVSQVTEMSAVFERATSFNQDIGNWDVSNVQNMFGMFNDAISFNQDIGNWDVSKVKYMAAIFSDAISFNQDIGNWNVSAVSFMQAMFTNAIAFNQDIGGWDVSSAEGMDTMFKGATSFNQDIGEWNVSNVASMDNMFLDTAISFENYDALLQGWSNLPDLRVNVTFSGGNSQYCLGKEARQKLIDDFGWTITDGGLSDDCTATCTTLPSIWTGTDIGAVATVGTSCYNVVQDTFEVTASGADIWGTNDEFHYVYQELTSDGEIIARVDGLINTHPWAKAGVMMRNSTDSDAAQILMSLSTNPKNVGIGYSLQDRPSKGAAMNGTDNNIGPVPVGSFPYYVRLVREGNNFTGYASAINGNWTLVGTKAITMNETILVGLATTSHSDGTSTLANYSEVSIKRGLDPVENTPPEIFLEGDDLVILFSGEPYVEQGATASDIEDGDISSSISISGSVDTTNPGVYDLFYFVSDSEGAIATAIRTVIVELAPDVTPPVISLIGPSSITLTVGEAYTELGATAIDNVDGDITFNIIIDRSGLDISNLGTSNVIYSVSDASGNEALEVRSVNVVPAAPCLPFPWRNTDIGDVAVTGTACVRTPGNSFEVTASGSDIWGTNDEFHFVYQRLSGDGEIITRVDGLTNTHPWAKAGVMMRNSTDSDAAQILMSLSINPKRVGIGYSLQDRPSKGAAMGDANNIGPVAVGSFPYYVRLVREGNTFTGYASESNGNWTLVGTKTISMNATILVGLATTSHNDGVLTTANYADVQLQGSTSAAARVDSRLAGGNTEDQLQNISNGTALDRNLLEMRTYPNPSSDMVNVSFGTILTVAEFQIYDITGRLISTQNATATKSGSDYRLNVRSFETGTYFIRAHDDAGRVYQKQLLIKR
ncbi:BspA family leucine-rich repeat surface protein, partial [Maribacter sp.]|nr:BspA family leucine-rich repeat surface protein [Maribacter sp.]